MKVAIIIEVDINRHEYCETYGLDKKHPRLSDTITDMINQDALGVVEAQLKRAGFDAGVKIARSPGPITPSL